MRDYATIDGPAKILCDNESVVKNSTSPESPLKKRHISIAYHKVREAQAAGTIQIRHIPGETNLADLLSKLVNGNRLKELAAGVLW